jgi:hypothetical protein
MIRVVGDLFSNTLFGELPVDKKFIQEIDLKTIIGYTTSTLTASV